MSGVNKVEVRGPTMNVNEPQTQPWEIITPYLPGVVASPLRKLSISLISNTTSPSPWSPLTRNSTSRNYMT
ncbi:hypothetical protein BGY98DRAFT_995505 [Russula aff. rugulosa BPL654]|nr:hypothetical protein BGY98DRAFT_995505 [Russula aff. rugulosa BPL654]